MSASQSYFKVVIEPKNGTRIAGKRRALNEVFLALERQVRFLVIEGVLVACNADGVPVSGSGGTGQADFSNPANSGLAPAV